MNINPFDELTELKLSPLPEQVVALCNELNAPPRLTAHLILVHSVAIELINDFTSKCPKLRINKEEITFGAATHDIGKAVFREELSEAGNKHESEGYKILKQRNISSKMARFTKTHTKWKHGQSITLEDLFVALADNCWKGKRDDELEILLSKRIAHQTGEEDWSIYIVIDDILQEITSAAPKRLIWQAKYSP
ncbi:MAG: hypothetical protein A2Z50_03415 [Nitrospirae bacterium RBG_19FT_COMBO_42_15]|nr:MAG: hypothetical protein A2Z50_03415 [Nitrospirae bacterium RBG_19FT_COMBO_42_15]